MMAAEGSTTHIQPTEEVLILPVSIDDLCSKYFSNQSLETTLQTINGYTSTDLTRVEKTLCLYVRDALHCGRPLNSAIIFMAGTTGVGKSSTINALFEDQNLCKTDGTVSATKHVSLIGKQLNVPTENVSVHGHLGFVDIPGTHDTSSRNDSTNMASVCSFLKSRQELDSRERLANDFSWFIRKSVYPNVVLLAVSATDNRTDGPDSLFAKTLRIIHQTGGIIDKKKHNLIVVLTHVMSIPHRDLVSWKSDIDCRTKVIRQQVKAILGLDVDVIPVENLPIKWDMEKSGDFYKLPDGQHSHLNLFQAMTRMFERNGDTLTHLLLSWYLRADCPEKRLPAKIVQSLRENNPEKINNASAQLQALQIPESSRFGFQFLAHGYCPVTEEIKPVTPVNLTGQSKKIRIGNVQFLIPQEVQVYEQDSTNFERQSFLKKQDYQQHMIRKYGIEDEFILNVNTNSDGRWLQNDEGENISSLVSLVHESRLATFVINNPREQDLSTLLLKDLECLPQEYNDTTKNAYLHFFSNWGTHIIVEEAVGGSIQLNCSIESSSINDAKLSSIDAKMKGFLMPLFQNNVTETHYDHITQANDFRKEGITHEHINTSGGKEPTLTSIETITSEVVKTWAASVAIKPTELRCSVKLYPYYNLLTENTLNANLRQATKDYLNQSLRYDNQAVVVAPSRNEISDREIRILNIRITTRQALFAAAAIGIVTGGFAVAGIATLMAQSTVIVGTSAAAEVGVTAVGLFARFTKAASVRAAGTIF